MDYSIYAILIMFTSKLYTKRNFCRIIAFQKTVFSVDFALKTRKIIINFRSIQRLLSLIFNLYLRAFFATFRHFSSRKFLR